MVRDRTIDQWGIANLRTVIMSEFAGFPPPWSSEILRTTKFRDQIDSLRSSISVAGVRNDDTHRNDSGSMCVDRGLTSQNSKTPSNDVIPESPFTTLSLRKQLRPHSPASPLAITNETTAAFRRQPWKKVRMVDSLRVELTDWLGPMFWDAHVMCRWRPSYVQGYSALPGCRTQGSGLVRTTV